MNILHCSVKHLNVFHSFLFYFVSFIHRSGRCFALNRSTEYCFSVRAKMNQHKTKECKIFRPSPCIINQRCVKMLAVVCHYRLLCQCRRHRRWLTEESDGIHRMHNRHSKGHFCSRRTSINVKKRKNKYNGIRYTPGFNLYALTCLKKYDK